MINSEIELKDLSINDILSIEDKSSVRVDIPEWNGCVYVRVMSATERSAIEDLYIRTSDSKRDTGKFRKELLRRTWVSKDGNPMITDDAIATHMMNKNALAIERIFERSCEVNGFRQKDVDTLKKK